MDWSVFLRGLFAEGQLLVPPAQALNLDELAKLSEELQHYERIYREEAPIGAPPWDPEAGTWAGAMLLRSTQFLIFRTYGPDFLKAQLEGDAPCSGPSAHYSIDLCFQYLPDVAAYARSASPDDPLVCQLDAWGVQFPLSSVGMPVTPDPASVEQLSNSPALWKMYIDRILWKDDVSRLDDPRVRNAVEQTIGAHPNLAPPKILRTLVKHEAI